MQDSRLPTVIIADELASFRDGLAALCELQGYARVVARAADGDEALRQIESLSPISPSSISCSPACTAWNWPTASLSLQPSDASSWGCAMTVRQSLRCFAPARRATSSNHRGSIPRLPQPGVGGWHLCLAHGGHPEDSTPGRIGARHDPISLLSAREYQVFSLLVEGVRAKEIAARLGLSPKTVDTHRANLMKKLDLYDVPALVRFALHHRLISC